MPAADVIAWFESRSHDVLRQISDAISNAWNTVVSWARGASQWGQDRYQDLQNQIDWLKNIVLKGPSVVFDTIGEIVQAIGYWISDIFWGISGFAWKYTGPLAPIILVIIAGGTIWASIWIAKRIFELL